MIDQALAFAIIGGMMVMFVWNRFRYDLVALLGLLIAVACGIVPVENAFAGFSDSVVIIVASVLVISAGVGKSNAIGRIIRRLQPHMQTTGGQVLVLTSGVTIMSVFMKNIGALAILLPIALQVA
jgi:di/tricarboxylate transporter